MGTLSHSHRDLTPVTQWTARAARKPFKRFPGQRQIQIDNRSWRFYIALDFTFRSSLYVRAARAQLGQVNSAETLTPETQNLH